MMLNLVVSLLLAASSPYRPVPGDQPAVVQPAQAKEKRVDCDKKAASVSVGGVANLPFAHGKRFATLDAYLAHLQCYAAPIDQPWWREIRPGVYEHVKPMPEAPREIATRAELMQRFGFTS